ncbi:hypothetical protein Tco_1361335 [Tanacetum coccineum]
MTDDEVSGQMTHFVASSTLDSAISCVMQGASCTQRKVSMVVIFVDVIVGVVIVVAIIGVVVFVMIIGIVVVVGGVPSIIKLSFAGYMYSIRTRHHLVKVPVANVTLSSSAHLLQENTDSVRSNQWMRNISRASVPIGLVHLPWQQSMRPGLQ